MVSKTTTEMASVEPSTWVLLCQGGVAKIASVHMDHVGACAMGVAQALPWPAVDVLEVVALVHARPLRIGVAKSRAHCNAYTVQ